MTADVPVEPAEVTQLDAVKARRFLRSLAERPFVAIVVEEDKVLIYSKGIDTDEALRRINALTPTKGESAHGKRKDRR